MALIICPECGRKISEYADFCPSCGCPKAFIKKLLAIQEEATKKATQKQLQSEKAYFLDSLNDKDRKLLEQINRRIKNEIPELIGKEYEKYYGYSWKESPFKCFVFLKDGFDLSLRYRETNDKSSNLKPFPGRIVKNADEVLSFVFKIIKCYELGLADSRLLVKKTVHNEVVSKRDGTDDFLIQKLEKEYKYAVRNKKVEKIRIIKIEKNVDGPFVRYQFNDGEIAGVNLSQIKRVLFPTSIFASMGLEENNNFKGVEEGKVFFVVTSKTSIFAGWKEDKKYDTSGGGYFDMHGHYDIVNVPIFVSSYDKALKFFSREGAEKIANQLKPFYPNVKIIEKDK